MIMTHSRIVFSDDIPRIYDAVYVRAFIRSVICAFTVHPVFCACPLTVPLYCSSVYCDFIGQ